MDLQITRWVASHQIHQLSYETGVQWVSICIIASFDHSCVKVAWSYLYYLCTLTFSLKYGLIKTVEYEFERGSQLVICVHSWRQTFVFQWRIHIFMLVRLIGMYKPLAFARRFAHLCGLQTSPKSRLSMYLNSSKSFQHFRRQNSKRNKNKKLAFT